MGKSPKLGKASIALIVLALVEVGLFAFCHADITGAWPWGDWPGAEWQINRPAALFWSGLLVCLALLVWLVWREVDKRIKRAKIWALVVVAGVVLLGWFYLIKAKPASCTVNESRPFWQHVQCGEPAAYSTIGTFVGAFFAMVIGITAIRINANTVRGQRIHEQIRMVLEVDRELIACPQLWEIFGRTTESTTELEAAKSNALPEALNTLAQTLRDLKEPTALLPVWAVLAGSVDSIAAATQALPRPVGERDKGQEKLELELKKEALVVSYFNMFDFVHGFYTGENSWFSPRSLRDEEDWQAWQNYIAYFFEQTNFPGSVWDKYKGKGIYSTNFVNFMSAHAARRKG